MNKKKLKILFVYAKPRKKLVSLVKQKKAPDTFLYGLNHLRNLGHQVDFFDYPFSKPIKLIQIFDPLHHLFVKKIGLGYGLFRSALLLPKLNQYDVIITCGDSSGLGVATLKALGLVKKPQIYTLGLFYVKKNFSKEIKKNTLFSRLYRKTLFSVDNIIYHTKIEGEKLLKNISASPKRATLIRIGSDPDYFHESEKRKTKDFVLSVGQDIARDYETLIKAASKIKAKIIIICRPKNIPKIAIPKNVKIFYNLPFESVKKHYQEAKLIAISLKEQFRSSGQTVLLDCMFLKKAIVISRTKGIVSAFWEIKDKKHCLFCKPNSPQDLASKINSLLRNPKKNKFLGENAYQLARKKFTSKIYTKNLLKIISDVTSK